MQGSFNLTVEKWIPVLWANGRTDRVGICQALTEAGSIRQIAASNPMDNVAILRFLLAVLYWCKGGAPAQSEKDEILAAGQFPADWFAKLDKEQDCFNLLGSGKRFYQDPIAKRERATTDLLQEIPTGNNFWHFRHSTDYEEGLCLACCTLGLLRLPLFTVSGLPDLKAGINGTPPIYVIPVGQSLLTTLCLNWVSCAALGIPAWETPGAWPLGGGDVPLLTGLTMLSRRVWLHAPDPSVGICIGCGSGKTTLIRKCEYQSAGAQKNESWADPHVIYVQRQTKGIEGEIERKALTTPDLTKDYFRLDKPWVPLFLQLVASRKKIVDLYIVGLATDKAKHVDVWERVFRMPTDLIISAGAESLAARLELWQAEGRKLAVRMKPERQRSGNGEFVAAHTAVRPHVESRVSARAAELLATPEQSWPQAVDEYRRMMPVLAQSLAPGFTTRAVQCRHHIANALPEMTADADGGGRKRKGKKGNRA